MDRIKRVRSGNFTQIDNAITRDNRASMKARGLLLTIMSLPDDWDFSVMGLSTIVKESKSGLYSIMDELLQLGYIVRTPRPKVAGKFAGSFYTFFEHPDDRFRETVSGFQDTESKTELILYNERKSPKPDDSHPHPQAYIRVGEDYVGTGDDFFSNLEEKGSRQGEQGLLLPGVDTQSVDPKAPIPETAHKHMYRVCYMAETVEQTMFLDSRQRGRVASVLGKLRDADADLNKLTQFEQWWKRFWKSVSKHSGMYQPPTPEQVIEHWTMFLGSLNGTGPPRPVQQQSGPSMQEVEQAMQRRRETGT